MEPKPKKEKSMKHLTILYDAECGLCHTAKKWLEGQESYFPLELLPLQSPAVDRRWPGLREWEPEKKIVAIDEEGGLYQGDTAWITILYALRGFRELALVLANPSLQGLVKQVVELISENRLVVSDLLGLRPGTPLHLLLPRRAKMRSVPEYAGLRDEVLR